MGSNCRQRRFRGLVQAGVVVAVVVAVLVPRSVGSAAAASAGTGPVPALSSDTPLFNDDFESGSLSNWQVTTAVHGTTVVTSGIGYNGTTGVHLTVPDSTVGSIAYIRHTLATPVYALSAVGYFKVLAGGCDTTAGYSQGDIPFFRFFDTTGKRIVGLYRINGSCSKTAKLYVQHSGNFYRTGKNISFGAWTKLELRAAVQTPSASLVQVYMNDVLVYQSTIANNGLLPFQSVTVHNEHPNQVGDLVADNIQLGTFDSGPPPTNPCNAATPLPTTSDPGTTVLADGFESGDFSNWTALGLNGDGTATIQTSTVHSGACAVKLHVSSAASSLANLSKTLPAGTSEVWADGWFDVQVPGTNTSSNVPFFRFFTDGVRIVDVYRLNGSGQLYMRLANGTGGFTYIALGRTLALNQFYELKVHAIANGTTNTVEVWLNGTRLYTTSAATLGVNHLSTVMLGSEHFAQEGDLVADDIVLKTVP